MLREAEHLLNSLADRHYTVGDGTRKAPSYLREYSNLLAHRREQPLRLLEIGVSSGASLLIWRDYLPNATIVGIDIAEPPPKVIGQERIHFVRCSQDDPELLDQAGAIAGGPFDLIIDDASHLGYLTKRSFEYLFPRWLVPGGTYVIEDFGTGFLSEYPDGAPYTMPATDDAKPETQQFVSHQFGMVGVVKQLIDHMMSELMTGQHPRVAIERMTVLTNIVFLQKAGGDGVATRGDASPGACQPQSLDYRLAPLVAELQRQGGRLTAVETLLRQVAATASRDRLP